MLSRPVILAAQVCGLGQLAGRIQPLPPPQGADIGANRGVVLEVCSSVLSGTCRAAHRGSCLHPLSHPPDCRPRPPVYYSIPRGQDDTWCGDASHKSVSMRHLCLFRSWRAARPPLETRATSLIDTRPAASSYNPLADGARPRSMTLWAHAVAPPQRGRTLGFDGGCCSERFCEYVFAARYHARRRSRAPMGARLDFRTRSVSRDMNDHTPRQIVQALDRYIIGQDEAKRGRGDRYSESLAPATAARGPARGRRAQEHPDDWARLASARRRSPGDWPSSSMPLSSRSRRQSSRRSAITDATWTASVRDLVERAVVLERAQAAETVRERRG